MTIIRYTPWQEINALQRQLENIFDDVTSPNNNYIPVAELTETKAAYELKLELPGINKADIDIQAMTNKVIVSGERQAPENTGRSEFHYGKFERAVALPKAIQNTKVTAKYTHGVLHLTLLKTEAEQNRIVKVNLAESAV